MGPKRQNRSPFGLFMIKMKRTEPGLRSMPMSQLVGHCAPFYENLPQEVRKRLEELSLFVRTKDLNDYETNRQLDQFSLEETTVSKNKSFDQNPKRSCSSAPHPVPSLPELGFTSSNLNSNLLNGNSYDFEEEVDYFAVLEKTFQMAEDFQKQPIVCICWNVLVYTQEGEYYPNEVGLTQFSLEEGVQRVYTKLIANEVPNGYYAEAKDFANAYHKIPLNSTNNNDFEGNYHRLFHEIYDFMSSCGLKDDKNRTLVFCRAGERSDDSHRNQVVGCLQWLDKKLRSFGQMTNKSLIDDFLVIDMSDLLFLTIQTYCKSVRLRSLCVDALTRSVFDFHPELRCDFHSEDENNYCALAVTKRTAYLFFHMLFAIELRPEFDLKSKPSHRPNEPVNNSHCYDMVIAERPLLLPRPRYDSEPQPEVAPQPNPALKRLQRTGLGRGRLVQNLKNLQKRF